jgi:hypothetical protein
MPETILLKKSGHRGLWKNYSHLTILIRVQAWQSSRSKVARPAHSPVSLPSCGSADRGHPHWTPRGFKIPSQLGHREACCHQLCPLRTPWIIAS